jgi:DNA-binding MarR family transcriptional regulator
VPDRPDTREGPLTDEQFARILEFRIALRRFGRFSEEQAAKLDMTAAQHQLLLAIRGHDDPRGPTIADVARALLVRHHSAVGLVDRTQDLGLIERRGDDDDHRLVRLALTPLGRERVNTVASAHLKELRRLAEVLGALIEAGT